MKSEKYRKIFGIFVRGAADRRGMWDQEVTAAETESRIDFVIFLECQTNQSTWQILEINQDNARIAHFRSSEIIERVSEASQFEFRNFEAIS
jgi:hypothetical protein